ncbi:MAG: hypothetical protein AB7F23_01205 [Phycisphaerae bacterium]|jgi:hypothetical protein
MAENKKPEPPKAPENIGTTRSIGADGKTDCSETKIPKQEKGT